MGICCVTWAFQVVLVVKNPPVSAGNIRNVGLIPGSGSSPRGGHGNWFQYSCLGNPMDRGTWWATVMELQRVGHDWSDLHTQTHTHRGLKPVLCDNLEGWDEGEMGEGRRGYMYNCGSFMLIHGRGQQNIVKQLSPNKKRKKKNGETISKGPTCVWLECWKEKGTEHKKDLK